MGNVAGILYKEAHHDDSPEEQPPQSDQHVKLMEDQLAGAKQFAANLLEENRKMKQKCRENIQDAKSYFRNKYLKLALVWVAMVSNRGNWGWHPRVESYPPIPHEEHPRVSITSPVSNIYEARIEVLKQVMQSQLYDIRASKSYSPSTLPQSSQPQPPKNITSTSSRPNYRISSLRLTEVLNGILDPVDVHPAKKPHSDEAILANLKFPPSVTNPATSAFGVPLSTTMVSTTQNALQDSTVGQDSSISEVIDVQVDSIFENKIFSGSPLLMSGSEVLVPVPLVNLPISSQVVTQSQLPAPFMTLSDRSEPSEVRVSSFDPSSQALRTLEVVSRTTSNFGALSRAYKIPSLCEQASNIHQQILLEDSILEHEVKTLEAQ
ncbi:hypothetical protein TIFTF001_039344, partial [Ficus carica]